MVGSSMRANHLFRWTLLYASLGCRSLGHAAVFSFGTTVNAVDVDLSSSGNPHEAVLFNYTDTGPMPLEDAKTTFEYVIYESSCSTVFAAFDDDGKAMYFDSFVVDAASDNAMAYLGIDLATIANCSLWTTEDNTTTTASLAFCGRLEVYYDGDLVTFVETDVSARVNLLQGGGFANDTSLVSIHMVQSHAVAQLPHVQVNYPLRVVCCDDTALTQTCPETTAQGEPIQLCVELASPQSGVRVGGVHTLSYTSSSQVFSGSSHVDAVRTGRVANLVTEVDCTQVTGVCRITFLPAADLFVDEDDQPSANELLVQGEAVIALGVGGGGRRTRGRRRLGQHVNQDDNDDTNDLARHGRPPTLQPFAVTIHVVRNNHQHRGASHASAITRRRRRVREVTQMVLLLLALGTAAALLLLLVTTPRRVVPSTDPFERTPCDSRREEETLL
jgi:hypothetical protein